MTTNVITIEKPVTIRIEKNVPIPDRIYNQVEGEWARIIDQMTEGDSVWISNERDAKRLYQAMHNRKIKSATRKEGSGYRVWRLG